MPNPFVHIELASSDVGRAKSFYASLFDWKLVDRDMGNMTYTMIEVGQGTGGGMMQHPMQGAPSAWIPYAQVQDVQDGNAESKIAWSDRHPGCDGNPQCRFLFDNPGSDRGGFGSLAGEVCVRLSSQAAMPARIPSRLCPVQPSPERSVT